jgi:hypothetical protein
MAYKADACAEALHVEATCFEKATSVTVYRNFLARARKKLVADIKQHSSSE